MYIYIKLVKSKDCKSIVLCHNTPKKQNKHEKLVTVSKELVLFSYI